MTRADVIARLKAIESDLRRRGVGALYLFGSHGRDNAGPTSDIDVFVDAQHDGFYDLSNFVGAYQDLRAAFPGSDVGYSTRDGLLIHVRHSVEQAAIRVF